MRQRAIADNVPQPVKTALHAHKSLIVDLGACSLLALVELSLLTFLMRLGLLDSHTSTRLMGDNLYYQAMAQNPFSSNPLVHFGPYCWRILTPWLVHLLTKIGLSVQGGFLLITTISLLGTVIGVYLLLRLIGATPWLALAVALLVQTQYALGLFELWYYANADSLTFLLMVPAFICYWQNRPRWLLVVLALGALNREVTLFVVAAFAGEQMIHRDWQRLKAYLPAYIVPVIIVIVIHIAIYQVGHYGLSSQIVVAWTQRSSLVARGSTLGMFGTVNPYILNIYHLTINSYGLLLPLLALQLIHPPYVVRRPVVWIFLLITITSSLIFAGDNERLMILAFPVFAVAAWYELRWIAQQSKLPAAAIGFCLVVVQGIFLLGQFFKTAQDFSLVTAIRLLEPHWMRMSWLLALLTLIGATLVVALWVLAFFVHFLYQRKRPSLQDSFASVRDKSE
jgi:hypothetical protein